MKMQKKTMQTALGCLLAAVMAVGSLWTGTPSKAYAATSSVIEKVTVTFKTTYGEAEEIPEPEITVSGTGFSLGDIQYRTDYHKWKPGKNVRVEITLEADDGKYFPTSLNRSDCKVSGADFVSAKALDNTTLQVKADYKPVTVLGDTEKAGWSDSLETRAVWKSVEYAPGYSLVLYGDNKVVKRMTLETNTADLTSYMEDLDKVYYYEVKAIPITSAEKKYLKEGNFVTSTDQDIEWEEVQQKKASSVSAGDGGSLKGNNYVMPDGSVERNTWKKLAGKWYFFDVNGNLAIGWTNVNEVWYYMDTSGAVCSGWQKLNGNWYYFGSADDGAMKKGWIEPQPGSWYYLGADGVMCSGFQNINGNWYYLGGAEDGLMKTGWTNVNGNWYYLNSSGAVLFNTIIDGWSIGSDGVARR